MLKRLKDGVFFVFNLYIFDTFASILVKGRPKVLGKSYCNLNNCRMEDLEREMLLIAQGNELAFNSFMNRYMDGLYYHSYGILYNKEMAEEIVSDVFLEVWKNRKKIMEVENMKAWLNTLIYRKSISYLRKEKKRHLNVSMDEMTQFCFPVTETPADHMISVEEMRSLQLAIEALPPKCKHVFFLAKIERVPYQQIAEMLDISLETVNYHIGFAMTTLKKKLKHG